MAKIALKSAQDIQDDILRKMSATKKLQLTWDFSSFLLKLNQLNKRDGVYRIAEKNNWNPGKAKT